LELGGIVLMGVVMDKIGGGGGKKNPINMENFIDMSVKKTNFPLTFPELDAGSAHFLLR